jgi:hypothetical protein
VTTTFDPTTTSQRPTEGSGSVINAAKSGHFPTVFWAAVILFLVNLLVLLGIWFSPELTVGMYGADEGLLAGSYGKPSPFTERVELAGARTPRQPEKVRPVFYEEPQVVEAAELVLPRTTMPAASERAATSVTNVHRVVESYSDDYPRLTASAARPNDAVRHVGSVDIAPRRATEQP